MRTIKFRAWANGKMYSFENKKWMTMSSSGYIAFQDTLEGSFDEDSDNCMSEDFHLMQFTGLTDKNGTEVYGGDIFKDNTYTYTVYWNKGAAGFKVKKVNHSGKLVPPMYGSIEEVVKNLTVTGNIYEM